MKCGDVQRAVFMQIRREEGGGGEGEGDIGDRESTGVGESSDEEGEDDDEGGGVRLPNSFNPPSSATMTAPKAKDGAPLSPQAYGLKVARQREQVRQAARRGVAFGLRVGLEEGGDGLEGGRKRVEAVQYGRVVEASFAKGEWGVRWKE